MVDEPRRPPAADRRVPALSAATLGSSSGDAALFEALQEYGFVVLTDHGVDLTVLQSAYALARSFFDLPLSEKQRYASPDGQRGYTAFGREHAKGAEVADLKEFWHVGREKAAPGAAPNIWPDAPRGFRAAFLALYEALDETGMRLLDALTGPLGVATDYFRTLATGGDSILRLLHYPPVPSGIDPRAIRAAPHEDINLITLLVTADGAGLELLDRDGAWRAIDAGPDAIIVDSGDMLARITNDVIPATTHRVVNPAGPNVSRYSMPFFLHPRADAVLSCIDSCRGAGAKYSDITAGEFLRERLREIGLAPVGDEGPGF